jgi:hypothetical protein
MKKLVLLLSLIIIGLSAQAKIYRVNNNPGTGAQFASFQTAHDSAHAGDTIYVEGTNISYGNVNINKKINVIGPGYFLAQNPQTQVNPTTALFGTIICATGSNGTYLTGLEANYLTLNSGVNNLVIKRNYIHGNGGIGQPSLYLAGNNANVLIIQNYITGVQNSAYAPLGVYSGCSSITISNNYCEGTGAGYPVLYIDPASSSVITNNIFKGTTNAGTTINNSTVNNNFIIIPNGTMNGSGSSMHNNFSTAAQFDTITGGNPNHNHIGINTANYFLGFGSSDGQWKLKPGSPAIGAGYNGEDCGIFGGLDPYVLSGMPTVPSVYFFAAPSSGSGTLPVHVKIKSNK